MEIAEEKTEGRRQKTDVDPYGGNMTTLNLRISGMNCGHCVGAVQKALAKVDGVEVGKVEIGSAAIRLDPARATIDAVRSAVEDAGYEVVEAK